MGYSITNNSPFSIDNKQVLSIRDRKINSRQAYQIDNNTDVFVSVKNKNQLHKNSFLVLGSFFKEIDVPFGKSIDVPLSFRQSSNIEDCYFLSAMYSLSCSAKGRKILNSVIKETNCGYEVNFQSRKITVSNEELEAGLEGDFVETDDTNLKVLELAYAKLCVLQRKEPRLKMAIYFGKAKDPLYEVTGGKEIYISGAISDNISDSNSKAGLSLGKKKLTNEDLKKLMLPVFKSFVENPDDIYLVAGTGKCVSLDSLDDGYKFCKKHAYAVKSIDMKEQNITLVDPYNSDKEINITFEMFFKNFNKLSGIDLRK